MQAFNQIFVSLQRSEVQVKESLHRSREAIRGFVGLFGKDGRIVSVIYLCLLSYLLYIYCRVSSFMIKRRN